MSMEPELLEIDREIGRRIRLYREGMDESAQAYEISELLEDVRQKNKSHYLQTLEALPEDLKAEVLSELPKNAQEDALEAIEAEDLADIIEEMDTDDAADIVQQIEEIDEKKAKEVLDKIHEDDSRVLRELIRYEEDEAGAYMQTELFKASIDETIGASMQRLKKLRAEGELDNAYHVFIVDSNDRFLGMMPMEDLVLLGPSEIYRHALEKEGALTIAVHPHDPIEKVIDLAGNYNMSVIPVLDEFNILLGRITADDIYDLMEKQATDQIYGMAGVQEESEESESLFEAGKSRAIWLGINLVTAIIASLVIGMFDQTIQSIVALAVLMPIVASMGGNAGTQSLTVTVRRLALGDIDPTEAKEVITKEVLLSFKKFLGDSVFVAHNVRFDYNFISEKLEQLGFGKLANRKLCSIDAKFGHGKNWGTLELEKLKEEREWEEERRGKFPSPAFG